MKKLIACWGVLLLACGGMDLPSEEPSVVATGDRAPNGTLSGLAGQRIWVQVQDPSTRQMWCDAFTAQGLIVECESDSSFADMNELFLKCPTIPDDAAAQITRFVGLPGMDVWDWRADSDYGPSYCDELDAISLELLR